MTMRLTSKGRYAVRAMLDLTAHSKGNPVRLQEISTRQNISLHYLEQLFRKLRNGRAVKSVRGPGGGYVLSRSMDEISVKDVLDCVGENINPARDIKANPALQARMSEVNHSPIHGEGLADTPEFESTKHYFENLGTIMQEYLATTSLGDLTRRTRGLEAANNAATADRTQAPAYSSVIRPNLGEVNQ